MFPNLVEQAVRRRRGNATEAGFTMIEVIVALILLGIVAAGAMPLMLTSIRSSVISKHNTQAKNLAQERLEQMRNLPYHVDAPNGSYIDLLDIYFRNLSATRSDSYCASGGYASATFVYTCVTPPQYIGNDSFTLTTTTQFIDQTDLRTPLAPEAGYDSQVDGFDFPASPVVGVTILVAWQNFTKATFYKVTSQISSVAPAASTIVSRGRATALRIQSSVLDPGGSVALTVQGGVVDSDGALSTGSSAAQTAEGVFASLASGQQSDGAKVSGSAPPNVATSVGVASGYGTLGVACLYACWANSSVSGDTSVQVTTGLPLVSASASPATASLETTSGGPNAWALKFYNDANYVAKGLDITNPPVFMQGSGSFAAGTGRYAASTGYMAATSGPTHNVTSAVSAGTGIIDILPTTQTAAAGIYGGGRPAGLIEVQLLSANLLCQNNGSGGTPTGSFSAQVRYFSSLLGGYSPWFAISSSSSNSLSSIPLSTIPVGVDASSNPLFMSDFIQSWGNLTSINSVVESASNVSRSNADGIISIKTKPTRTIAGIPDATSEIAVTVGELSCRAEDYR